MAKLVAAEKPSKVFLNLVAAIFIWFVFSLCLLFASFTVAYLVGEWAGAMLLGFSAMTLFYLLLGIIAWFPMEKLI